MKEPESSSKAKYFVAGAAVTATVAAVVGFFIWAPLSGGDRPPIIVKGGSVLIENQPFKGKSTGPGWADDGADWKSDQQNGIDVSKYLVGVVGGVSGTCEDLEGETVEIEHNGSGPTLKFRVIGSKEPKVGPKGQLTPETSGGLKRLRFGGEGVSPTRVLVYDQNPQQAQACQLGSNSQVWIWPVQ